MKIKDLKKWRVLFFEIGLIISLLIFLAAFKIEFKVNKKLTIPKEYKEPFRVEDIPVTQKKKTPPAPLKPSVFQPLPDDTPLEDLPDLSDIAWEPDEYIPLPGNTTEDDDEAVPFFKVEKKPELISGADALYKKITYPQKARFTGIEGIVILEFTVDASGRVQNPVVSRGIGGGCDQAALEALKQMHFNPGMQRGIAVPVRMRISVVFRLQ